MESYALYDACKFLTLFKAVWSIKVILYVYGTIKDNYKKKRINILYK